MSVRHFRCVLKSGNTSSAKYDYCPDYIGCDELCGQFEIESTSWSTVITNQSPKDSDGRSVSALAYKIRMSYADNNEFPPKVFFTA